MSWSRPTLSELVDRAHADIDTRLPGADSRLRRSVLDVLARLQAGQMHALYGALSDNANFLPDTTDAARLARWASIFGLDLKAAEPSTGTVTLTGVDETEILAGTILVRIDGTRYLIADTVAIDGTDVSAAITAEIAGAEAAMATGQTLTFVSPIANVDATATVEAPGIAGGADAESTDSLRGRLLLRIRNPIRGGAASDYVSWALEVPGVTRAWVYENASGLGTVKVLFVCDGRDDIIPEGGDVTAVAAWIAPRRPVCAAVTVAAPIADELDFDIDLTPNTDAVKAAVEAALRDLISREAEPGGTLLISHIREAISTAAGEFNHVLNSPSASVTVAAGHISTFGAISW